MSESGLTEKLASDCAKEVPAIFRRDLRSKRYPRLYLRKCYYTRELRATLLRHCLGMLSFSMAIVLPILYLLTHLILGDSIEEFLGLSNDFYFTELIIISPTLILLYLFWGLSALLFKLDEEKLKLRGSMGPWLFYSSVIWFSMLVLLVIALVTMITLDNLDFLNGMIMVCMMMLIPGLIYVCLCYLHLQEVLRYISWRFKGPEVSTWLLLSLGAMAIFIAMSLYFTANEMWYAWLTWTLSILLLLRVIWLWMSYAYDLFLAWLRYDDLATEISLIKDHTDSGKT